MISCDYASISLLLLLTILAILLQINFHHLSMGAHVSCIKKSLIFMSLAAFLNPLNSFAEDITAELKAPFYAVQKESEGHHNEMMILNHGITAFWKRIELIRNAKKNIEVEYFIYGLDDTSKAFTSELIKASERGVKVRILVDKSAAIFVLDEYYAKALAEKGVEVKYYNDASLIRFSTVNFRNHRKLLSVDDELAITGGRNIEDDYFDFSEEFNFLDRDVLVKGDIVKVMRESFDEFFNNKMAATAELPDRPKDRVKKWVKNPHGKGQTYKEVSNEKAVKKYVAAMEKARSYTSEDQRINEIINRYEASATKLLSGRQMVTCPETTFATDAPGGNFYKRLFKKYGDDYRFLRKVLFQKAAQVDNGLILSSPYVINSPKSREIYDLLLERNIPIEVYTNSLASTDAVYVAANLYTYLKSWVKNDVLVYLHSGEYENFGEETVANVSKAKWGTHSKTQLYKYKDSTQNEFMIGTYNFDNRSNHYNTEMALFCKGSDSLFADVEDSIHERMGRGYRIDKDKKAYSPDGKEVSIYGASKDNLFLMRAIGIPSVLFQLLL